MRRLLRQQAALASFGSFAFREPDLLKILNEAARICAESLEVPFCKVCRYRAKENDLLIEAGCGWQPGVIGRVVSQADESSPQGRAYVTREPVIMQDLNEAKGLALPAFYAQHGIVSTIDVVIRAFEGAPFGILEIDSPTQHTYDEHDINFLTGFANVLAEAVATATRVQALKTLLDEKDVLARELQHRVRNNLQLIQGMLVSYAKRADDGSATLGIDTIVRRVMTLGKVYDHLLGTGMSRSIDFGDYVKALCATLPDLQVAPNPNLDLTCRAEPMFLDLDMVTALGMVVAELVTNSFGHAFPDGRRGTIDVSLSASGPRGEATLSIKDNGVGFDGRRESKRHGLGLVRRLMQQVEGSVDVRSDEGTTWTLKFLTPSEFDGAELYVY